MKLNLIRLFVIASFLIPVQSFSQENPASGLININKLAMWVQADGTSARNPYSSNAIDWGVLYPRGTPVGVVFVDGLVWGGFVQDGQEPALRVGGHAFRNGLQPGGIISPGMAEDPNDPMVNRVWRYRPDWQTADLTSEALDILISMPGASDREFQFTQEEINAVADSLRMAYENDLNEWPWQKGAPFYDINENGVMDEGEEPGLLNADQVVWYVVNDLDSELTDRLYGSPPIGIEMQVTLWAYDEDTNIENIIFRRMRLVYKGTSTTPNDAHIDSMALGLYSEVDLGSAGDDFAGTDTTLQTVFAYNSTALDPAYQEFSYPPPAIGYTVLWGPRVPSSNTDDRGVFDFLERRGSRNLLMTGSWIDRSGDFDSAPSHGTYDGTLQFYNVLNGFRPRPVFPPDPFRDPGGNPTRFTFTGDPVTNTGWVDSNSGNRQVYLTTAFFNMALGDTQEVILAMTAGLGSDRLASVNAMKFFVRHAKEFASYGFDKGIEEPVDSGPPKIPDKFTLLPIYPNPSLLAFDSQTTIRYELSDESHVILRIFDVIGREVRILVDATLPAGSYDVQWDHHNSAGHRVSNGIYLCRMESGGFGQVRKVIIVR